jgi:hypothetical protein
LKALHSGTAGQTGIFRLPFNSVILRACGNGKFLEMISKYLPHKGFLPHSWHQGGRYGGYY